MKAFLTTWCTIAAALLLAVLGIFDVIDQTTMIVLVVVLIVCSRNGRGACRAVWRA